MPILQQQQMDLIMHKLWYNIPKEKYMYTLILSEEKIHTLIVLHSNYDMITKQE